MTQRVARTITSKRSIVRILRGNDRGIALPMVLMVFILGVALISAFLVAIVGSSRVTVASKANVQAQAAAEAGIAAARVLITDPCPTNGVPPTVPAGALPDYEVKVFPCDTTRVPVTVKIRSTGSIGKAPDKTAAIVESIFAVATTGGTPGLLTTTSLYIVKGSDSSLHALNVSSSATPPPPVIISEGDFKCGGSNFSIPGDLIVVDGRADLGSGNCQVHGNIFAKGDVITGYGNVVGGNIYSRGKVTVQSPLGTASKPTDVYAVGDVELHYNIALGSIFTGGNATVNGIAENNVSASGTISVADDGRIKGTRSPGAAAPTVTIPTRQEVPQWVDYGFDMSNWSGYQLVTWNQATCKEYAEQSAKWATVDNYTKNTVIDARACADGLVTSWGSPTLSLKANITFILNKGEIRQTMTIQSADAKEHLVSFITPDASPAVAGPQCPANGGNLIFGNTQVLAPISVNVYTPCGVTLRTAALRGGLFVNGLTMEWGNTTIAAGPIVLPGASFGTGGGSGAGVPLTRTLGALQTQRNVSN